MNFKDIIGPDELDWKVIPLDWKKIGKDELKLGTPMSKDGLEANDASCYGILMDDVEKGKHFQARVIVSGCVDFDKAEAYSGVKISEEAKKAIGKVWSQGGGGLTELPEGYPYKEMVVGTLYEGTDVRFEYDGSSASTIEPVLAPYALTAGEKYTVIWDGVEYPDLVAFVFEGGTVIGADFGTWTDEMPFTIMVFDVGDGFYMGAVTHSNANTHSFAVIGSMPEYKTMDANFLPKFDLNNESAYGVVSVYDLENFIMPRLRLELGKTTYSKLSDFLEKQSLSKVIYTVGRPSNEYIFYESFHTPSSAYHTIYALNRDTMQRHKITINYNYNADMVTDFIVDEV